jgi:diaminopimelate epimerase
MLGWTLACGSAELAAAALMGERQDMVGEFSLARF